MFLYWAHNLSKLWRGANTVTFVTTNLYLHNITLHITLMTALILKKETSKNVSYDLRTKTCLIIGLYK